MFVGYSDGLTEAMKDEEPFGEARLLEAVQELSHLAPEPLVAELLRRVQEFCGGGSSDDLTLVIGKGR